MFNVYRLSREIVNYIPWLLARGVVNKARSRKSLVMINGKNVMYNEYGCSKSSQNKLKINLIALREVPQTLLIKEIGSRNCIHDGEFCFRDQECWGCELSNECMEIISNFEKLSIDTPMGTILKKTFIARDYMLSKLDSKNHLRSACGCVSCNWLRQMDVVFADIYEG